MAVIARNDAERALANGHVVQFYDDDAFLCEAVAQHLASGLVERESVLAIVTEPHRDALSACLVSRGFDVPRMIAERRLHLLDARETLDSIMVDGEPDRARLAALVDSISRGPLRAYGEMVDVLARDGREAAALALEHAWNDVGRERSLFLMCAYALSSFPHATQAGVFRELCDSHTRVRPAESYASVEDADRRLRVIAELQQRARALEGEIEQRAQIQRALVEAVSAREDFLSVASHELRTPLTALRLQLTALTRSPAADGVLESVERASRQVDRLTDLVEQLLDVTRLTRGTMSLEREEVDLCALVRNEVELASEMAARAGSPIELHERAPVIGRFDARRIAQVTDNLLSNALKYGAGAPIDIVVERVGETAVLKVRDRGRGIAPEDHRRIFGRFERAAPIRNYGGLGLGLWIVLQVVEAHGGSIRVESELGTGATFIVELPLAA